MKILFIILFCSSLFSQEIIFIQNNYDFSYIYETSEEFNNSNKEHKEKTFDFNIKFDFKYKLFQTNNVSLNSFEEQRPVVPKTSDPLDFEITGFYFEFKTAF